MPYPSHSQMRNVDANRTLCSVDRRVPRNDARHQQRDQIKAKALAKEQILDRPSVKVPPADPHIGVVADGHGAQVRLCRHPESGERIAEEDLIRQAFGEESTTRDRDTREDRAPESPPIERQRHQTNHRNAVERNLVGEEADREERRSQVPRSTHPLQHAHRTDGEKTRGEMRRARVGPGSGL